VEVGGTPEVACTKTIDGIWNMVSVCVAAKADWSGGFVLGFTLNKACRLHHWQCMHMQAAQSRTLPCMHL
jgi:hypothetical protein